MAQNPIKGISKMGFQWETRDPFLFCVHHEDYYPKGNSSMGPANQYLQGRNIGMDFEVKDGFRMYHGEKIPGFPNHPHRGFETVTVVRSGFVDHSDSMGASGRYSAGDVQWMTAGAGVQHSEMFPLIKEDEENKLELFQIWLNLPRVNKFVKPHFTMLWNESIPRYTAKDTDGKKIEVEIIAGSLGGMKAPSPPPDSWAADPKNQVAIWIIRLESGAKWTLPASNSSVNRMLYFFRGKSLSVAANTVMPYNNIDLISDQDVLLENGEGEAQLLLLQAKPIGEPVVQYGPFVMNTRQEIQDAFNDFQATHFGGWSWTSSEPVHDRKKGRFAKHADGKEEFPNA
ncbi:MAG TPA: pirin family protein [Leptospiraceae bacterium]|nr:pirin family protein [Leptospiraceae bacterium]HMW06090.1 pirin family protein [Leptospiraceae bacterium]HMX35630.1 pirin family protein [Leptospiraceae bacterium]HMY31369.1 pirin family protein [Leptospiraceae bacterium]HMZ65012.1 pirin family protein [Leptospiraceae bacterium]